MGLYRGSNLDPPRGLGHAWFGIEQWISTVLHVYRPQKIPIADFPMAHAEGRGLPSTAEASFVRKGAPGGVLYLAKLIYTRYTLKTVKMFRLRQLPFWGSRVRE